MSATIFFYRRLHFSVEGDNYYGGENNTTQADEKHDEQTGDEATTAHSADFSGNKNIFTFLM